MNVCVGVNSVNINVQVCVSGKNISDCVIVVLLVMGREQATHLR